MSSSTYIANGFMSSLLYRLSFQLIAIQWFLCSLPLTLLSTFSFVSFSFPVSAIYILITQYLLKFLINNSFSRCLAKLIHSFSDALCPSKSFRIEIGKCSFLYVFSSRAKPACVIYCFNFVYPKSEWRILFRR